MNLDEKWSLGVLVGLPVLGVMLLIGVLWLLALLLAGWEDLGIPWTMCIVYLLGCVAILGFGYYPYESEYHKWIPKSGVVQDVNSRLVADGETMSEKILVIIDGQEYGCEDTRCSPIKKGDVVTMRCKRSWQWANVPGYDCRFISRKAA